MNKTLLMALVLGLSPLAFANNVTDTLVAGQSPTAGDILYYNGISGNTAGTWAQPSSIPGLQGAPGNDGTNGSDGVNGSNGVDGAAGANGKDGSAGANGTNGINGKNFSAPAIDPRLNVEIRYFDSQHWFMASGASFALQTGSARYIVTQTLGLKLGKSYEEKQREKLEKDVRRLQDQLNDNNVLMLPN